MPASVDFEVVAGAKRRNISNADQHRIVLAALALTRFGETSALIDCESVHSSALDEVA